MKTLMTSTVIAIGVLAFTSLAAGTAQAQQYGPQRFASQYPSSVAGCPSIAWRLVRDTNGSVHGMAWYTDMSGASEVKGLMQSGQFNLALTRSMGNGPVGTVTGTRNTTTYGTTTKARLTGEGCANMDLDLQPLPGGGWGAGG